MGAKRKKVVLKLKCNMISCSYVLNENPLYDKFVLFFGESRNYSYCAIPCKMDLVLVVTVKIIVCMYVWTEPSIGRISLMNR